ncbi:MAG: thiamine phosphate synthase [Elusimicrobiota bacterium]
MFKAKLYCITCETKELNYDEQVEKACEGGADAVLFKPRNLTAKEILFFGQRIKDICAERKALFILNDRPDLALALNCDGVHLGQNDIPIEWARQVLGGIKVVGRTASSLGQATSAAKESADYIMLGPIYSAPEYSKKETVNIDLIRMVKDRVKIPVMAFGGIGMDNAREILDAGADGIAVSRAVCGAKDAREAAAALKAKISGARTAGTKYTKV